MSADLSISRSEVHVSLVTVRILARRDFEDSNGLLEITFLERAQPALNTRFLFSHDLSTGSYLKKLTPRQLIPYFPFSPQLSDGPAHIFLQAAILFLLESVEVRYNGLWLLVSGGLVDGPGPD